MNLTAPAAFVTPVSTPEDAAEFAAFLASAAPQHSAEWFAARAGKVTASRFRHVVAKLKRGGYAEARDTYLWELVIERITGSAADHFASAAMQWGTDNEAGARMAYEGATGAMVEEVGFLLHPQFESVGGSPDGLIGDDGGFEAKCPFNSAVHLRNFIEGMPAEHRHQVQGLMWITGRAWWDYVSYDPRLPAPFARYVQRIARDEDYIAELQAEVSIFLGELDAMVNRVTEFAKAQL